MIGLSPMRPGSLPAMPPVEVAAARSPSRSRATAPTVPWRNASSSSGVRIGKPAPPPFENVLQGLPPVLGIEVIPFGEGKSLAAAESDRAFAGQQHMRRMLHDGTRRQNRVFWATDGSDS